LLVDLTVTARKLPAVLAVALSKFCRINQSLLQIHVPITPTELSKTPLH
jgi:hypothetical protein